MMIEHDDPFGGELRCESAHGSCGNVQLMDRAKAEHYTKFGWPRCCGYTMLWHTPNDLKKERAAHGT